MAHMLKEASEGAVPQQGAVPPVIQGAIIGHMPDPQVLSLDDQVAKGSGKQPTLSLTRAGEFTEQKTHVHSTQQS